MKITFVYLSIVYVNYTLSLKPKASKTHRFDTLTISRYLTFSSPKASVVDAVITFSSPSVIADRKLMRPVVVGDGVVMAGWDEEAILMASLVVDDTPERDLKQKKRPELGLKTPPTNSRRKRGNRRRSSPIQATVLNLDEEDELEKKQESVEEEKTDPKLGENGVELGKKIEEASSSKAEIPCMDRLREELSCAVGN